MDPWDDFGESQGLLASASGLDNLFQFDDPTALEDAQNVLFDFEAGLKGEEPASEVDATTDAEVEDEEGLFLLTPPTMHQKVMEQVPAPRMPGVKQEVIDLTADDDEDTLPPPNPKHQPIALPTYRDQDIWDFTSPPYQPNNTFQPQLTSIPMAPGLSFTTSTDGSSNGGSSLGYPTGDVTDLEGMLGLLGVVSQMGTSPNLPAHLQSSGLEDWSFMAAESTDKVKEKAQLDVSMNSNWAFPLPPKQLQPLLPPAELFPAPHHPATHTQPAAQRPPMARVPSRNVGTTRPPSKPTLSSRPDFIMASYNPKSPMASPTKKRAPSPSVAASDLQVVSSKLPLVRQPKSTPERKTTPLAKGSPSRVPMFALSRKVVQAFKAQKAERMEEMSRSGLVGPSTLRTHKKSPSTAGMDETQFATQTSHSGSQQARKASGPKRDSSKTPILNPPSQSFMDQNWTFPSTTPILQQEGPPLSALGAYTSGDVAPIGGTTAADGDAWLLDLFGLPSTSQQPAIIPGVLDAGAVPSSSGLTPFLNGGTGWSTAGGSSENWNWDVGAKRAFDSVVAGEDDSFRAAKRVRL